jgi:hypothetical protein
LFFFFVFRGCWSFAICGGGLEEDSR